MYHLSSCRVVDITGFSSDNFIGSRLRDYFHPSDYLKLVPCEVMCECHMTTYFVIISSIYICVIGFLFFEIILERFQLVTDGYVDKTV